MKKLALSLLVLILLLGAYFFLRHYPFSKEFAAPDAFRIGEWKADRIDAMTFQSNQADSVVLREENGSWHIGAFPADSERIDEWFSSLQEATVTSRVSTNSLNHERFEVDAQNAVTVVFSREGEELQRLLIGKSAGGDSVYVRLPDDEDVYVLTGLPRYLISLEQDFWRDRHVFTLKSDEIRLVRYQTNVETWELKKNEQGWSVARNTGAPVSLDETKVMNWLSGLVNMQASAFPEPEQQILAPVKTLTVETGTQDTFSSAVTLSIGNSDEANLFFVQPQEAGYPFLVPQPTVESTLQDFSSLVTSLAPSAE